MNEKTSGTENGIDERTRKAATESMTVSARGSGKFDVYSGENSRYEVDLIAEKCDCPDSEYNPQFVCKHRQRVEMEIGEREIPDLGGRLDVEVMSGRSRETENAPVATDGGAVVDAEPPASEPEIPDAATCSPKKARELTHDLAMDTAAAGDLKDWGEHQATVDVLWSSINAAIGEEAGR